MYKTGFYCFEGNTLIFDGYEVFDMDSREIYPIEILEISDFIGGLE